MSDKSKVEIIQAPSTLQDRATLLTSDENHPLDGNPVLQDLTEQFVQRLPEDLKRIENALTALEASPHDDCRVTVLFRLVHDLKGLAGTFSYPLISEISHDFCRFLEMPQSMMPRRLAVLRYHLDALKVVHRKRITGDGGDEGMRLINTLHTITQKAMQD